MGQTRFNSHNQIPPTGSRRAAQARIVRRGIGVSVLFLIVWTCFSFFALALSVHFYVQERDEYVQLQASGVMAQATVIDKEIEYDAESDDHYVTYQFDAESLQGDAARFIKREQVSSGTYRALERGAKVEIRYVPQYPEISRIESEYGPPSLLVIAVTALFVLVGLAMTVFVWRARKSAQESDWENTPAQDELFAPSVAVAPEPDLVPETLYCEQCYRPLGPELVDCVHRAQGACPYVVDHSSGFGIKGGGCVLVAFGLVFAGIALLGMLGGAPMVFNLCSFPFVIVGLCVVAAGIFVLIGGRLAVYNRATGQMWAGYRLFGVELAQAIAPALRQVSFHAISSRRTRYPASVCALCQRQDAALIFYTALLSLINQDAVRLAHTQVSIQVLHKRFPAKGEFVLLPGEDASVEQVAGELERRIVQAIREWSQRTDPSIRGRNYARVRALPHLFTLGDLVTVVFQGQKRNPTWWLVANVVGAEASQSGLGHVEKSFWRTRFAPLAEYQSSVLAEYHVCHDVHEKFKAAQPDMAPALWKAIQKTIEGLVPSND